MSKKRITSLFIAVVFLVTAIGQVNAAEENPMPCEFCGAIGCTVVAWGKDNKPEFIEALQIFRVISGLPLADEIRDKVRCASLRLTADSPADENARLMEAAHMILLFSIKLPNTLNGTMQPSTYCGDCKKWNNPTYSGSLASQDRTLPLSEWVCLCNRCYTFVDGKPCLTEYGGCNCPAVGDVNNDGRINTADALQVLRHLVGASSKVGYDKSGEINQSWNAALVVGYGDETTRYERRRNGNKVTMSDALQILRYCVNLSSEIPSRK
ncbi:MAG: dockerin type I repeat-containing protein [Oscillospiraceae bacterium]|nr:dockerin type I repeat-containing protein [Oscillospiraceae bacterium]